MNSLQFSPLNNSVINNPSHPLMKGICKYYKMN